LEVGQPSHWKLGGFAPERSQQRFRVQELVRVALGVVDPVGSKNSCCLPAAVEIQHPAEPGPEDNAPVRFSNPILCPRE
jgi:hypothetical protein